MKLPCTQFSTARLPLIWTPSSKLPEMTLRAGGVGAAVVALHHIAAGARAVDHHAEPHVAGDDVACPRRRAADGVPGPFNPHAARVGDAGRARRVGAEIVAFDAVAAAGDV